MVQRPIGGGNSTSSNTRNAERSSNLELYRIIVMFLIVAHHYYVNSGLRPVAMEHPMCTDSLFYSIFCAWGKTGINCFVLITGYFMCKSNISLRKFLKLILWVLTYGIFFKILFTLSGYDQQSWTSFLKLIPMRNISSNYFTSCYLCFFLCIPFLNILVRSMTKYQHQCLICLCFFLYTIHTLPGFSINMNYVSWFSVLYFIASYLRLYPLQRDTDTTFWAWMTLLSWGLSIASIVVITRFLPLNPYCFISDSNAVLALTNGVTSFMLFKNLKIKNSKVINTIAASSFGVLLIHANSDTMRNWLWRDTVDCIGHYESPWYYCIGCVVLIYTFCTIIDIIRRYTIETPLLNWAESLCFKIRKYYCKI